MRIRLRQGARFASGRAGTIVPSEDAAGAAPQADMAASRSGVQVGVCQGFGAAVPGMDERNSVGAARTATEPGAGSPDGGIWAADGWACGSSAACVADASKGATRLAFNADRCRVARRHRLVRAAGGATASASFAGLERRAESRLAERAAEFGAGTSVVVRRWISAVGSDSTLVGKRKTLDNIELAPAPTATRCSGTAGLLTDWSPSAGRFVSVCIEADCAPLGSGFLADSE